MNGQQIAGAWMNFGTTSSCEAAVNSMESKATDCGIMRVHHINCILAVYNIWAEKKIPHDFDLASK